MNHDPVLRAAPSQPTECSFEAKHIVALAAAFRVQQIQAETERRLYALSNPERNFEIKSQNAILVQKMISQKMGSYHKLSNPVFGKQSLNEIIARKRNSQIAQDNKVGLCSYTDYHPEAHRLQTVLQHQEHPARHRPIPVLHVQHLAKCQEGAQHYDDCSGLLDGPAGHRFKYQTQRESPVSLGGEASAPSLKLFLILVQCSGDYL